MNIVCQKPVLISSRRKNQKKISVTISRQIVILNEKSFVARKTDNCIELISYSFFLGCRGGGRGGGGGAVTNIKKHYKRVFTNFSQYVRLIARNSWWHLWEKGMQNDINMNYALLLPQFWCEGSLLSIAFLAKCVVCISYRCSLISNCF